ncbi:hypothetical protein RhiirB3_452059 [Rhizophagus irregularis]|nr:hypothetical protein RhiirB3_452059 [Rhizophagus irregularis]
MHAPSNKGKQQPPNASPDLDNNGAPSGDHTPDPVVTLAMTRDDFKAAAASNATPESLKKFPTNKALIETVNNLFLETSPDNLMAYFKKFGNITSCRLFSRPNAKVQQARIVYDNADSIAHFTDQWAVYCFSTCLRITPCFYTVDQKAARYQYVATLTQLPQC